MATKTVKLKFKGTTALNGLTVQQKTVQDGSEIEVSASDADRYLKNFPHNFHKATDPPPPDPELPGKNVPAGESGSPIPPPEPGEPLPGPGVLKKTRRTSDSNELAGFIKRMDDVLATNPGKIPDKLVNMANEWLEADLSPNLQEDIKGAETMLGILEDSLSSGEPSQQK